MVTVLRLITLILSLGAGAAATVALKQFDQQRSESARLDAARHWTSQISHQIDSVARAAREQGDPDPVGSAVNLLAQGVEPRQATLLKIQGDLDFVKERVRVDSVKGQVSRWFESSRIFSSETGVGVKISIRLEEWGFLGARSKFQADLQLALCTVALGLTFFLLIGWPTGLIGKSSAHVKAELKKEQDLRDALLLDWVTRAKGMVQKSGGHVRDVISDVNIIAEQLSKSRECLKGVREGIHSEITSLHGRHFRVKAMDQILKQVPSQLQQTKSILDSLGPTAKKAGDAFTTLSESVNQLQEQVRESIAEMETIERQLEPWSMDADIAFHAFVDADKAFHAMSNNLRLTIGALVEQVQTIKEIQPTPSGPKTPASSMSDQKASHEQNDRQESRPA